MKYYKDLFMKGVEKVALKMGIVTKEDLIKSAVYIGQNCVINDGTRAGFGNKFIQIGCNNVIQGEVDIGNNVTIGNNNVIESGVVIGNGVTIGDNNVIKSLCRVGKKTVIENFVLLKRDTQVGDDCYIDSYVRSSGDNVIGSKVILRFGSTIARKVVVDQGAFVSPNVMTIYSKHTGEKSSGTNIGKNSFIGTAAVIGPDVHIGKNVVIGAQAYVAENCFESKTKGVYVGVPAKFKEIKK